MNERYILHANFNQEVERVHRALVNDVADRFGVQVTRTQNIPAHITLKYWFEADQEQLPELDSLLTAFAKSVTAEEVILSVPSGFPPHVVFRSVILSPGARKIFEDLMASLGTLPWLSWDQYDAPNLHFHSTLAEECGSKYRQILQYLERKRLTDLPTDFDNITLTKQTGLVHGLPKLDTYRVYHFR